jgi:hypothetical protein
MTIEIIILFDK